MIDIYAIGRVAPEPNLFSASKCRCKHPLWFHEPNDLYAKDPEKYAPPWNGVCSVRECACCGFVPSPTDGARRTKPVDSEMPL